MKLFFRILLFTVCINTGLLFKTAQAQTSATPPIDNSNSISVSSDATPAQPPKPVKVDTLDKLYVALEVTPSVSTSSEFSILRTLQTIVKMIKPRTNYSLLNWKTYSRSSSQLQVEGYKRVLHFGRWINDPTDDSCFNTRAKVLMRDSDKSVILKDTNHCVIMDGYWHDPYTNQVFETSQDIQIDHLVPLKNAYDSGAYKWNFKSRCLYANYLGEKFHLLSVNGKQNMIKGDKAPDVYMPPNPEYACTYLKNWLSVKFLWGLKMTVSESQAISRLISDNHCNTENFKLSDREIMIQQQFARDNFNLCDKIDQLRNAAAQSDDSTSAAP